MPSTRSPRPVTVAVQGAQRPRLFHAPKFAASAGEDAIKIAALAGLELDDWQQFVLRQSLGENPDGSWAAPTVALVCPRQNGKNSILEARELAGLFLFGERVIIHSAHEQATASEQFRRLLGLIEAVPEFRKRMLKPIRGKGSEAIELTNGQRILFKTRTGGGARGFSIDLIVFDESYELSESAISAMVPALSARPNTQRWYTSSAVDQEKHANGLALARQRERGLAHKPNIAYFEWSAEGDDPGRVSADLLADPQVWAQANPALGDRIDLATVQGELDGDMGAREFAVERLGIGDWPDVSGESHRVISPEAWASCAEHDRENRIESGHAFAVDVNPDRSWGSIAIAGVRGDDLAQFAVIDRRRGTSWIVDRCEELAREHPGASFVVLASGPAANLIDDLEQRGLSVVRASGADYGVACSDFFDAIEYGTARYPAPQPDLDDALAGARKSTGQENAWTWSRKASTSPDISPLVAVTLALWGSRTQGPPNVWSLSEVLAGMEPDESAPAPDADVTALPPGFVPLDAVPVRRGLFRP